MFAIKKIAFENKTDQDKFYTMLLVESHHHYSTAMIKNFTQKCLERN